MPDPDRVKCLESPLRHEMAKNSNKLLTYSRIVPSGFLGILIR